MINLIPSESQRQLDIKRFQRALIAFGFFVAALLSIGFVMLLPSFIASRYLAGDLSYAREVEARSLTNRALEERTQALVNLERQARGVLARAQKTSFEDIVQEVTRVAPLGIDLSAMKFQNGTLTLEGRYQHRSSFLVFLDALKTMPLIKGVASPLSNLLKETDAPFNIVLSL